MKRLILLTSIILLVHATPAWGYSSACSVTKAKADVAAAKKAVAKAEKRLAETRRVLQATKTYTAIYGRNIGRWVRLCRRSGFSWANIPTAMKVLSRESPGNPKAVSPCGTYWGMWQQNRAWWEGKFNPFNPVAQTRSAAKSVNSVGWLHWPTAY